MYKYTKLYIILYTIFTIYTKSMGDLKDCFKLIKIKLQVIN